MKDLIFRGLAKTSDLQLCEAAPDLLEACKLCVDALRDGLQYDNPGDPMSMERIAYDAARAAIDKASQT